MAEKVYLNGRLVPRHRAVLSPFDHGFLFGYGLYEVIRAYHGVLFRLERHLARLRRAAEDLDLVAGLSRVDLGAACLQTLQANRWRQAAIRLTVSGGPGEPWPNPSTQHQPTILITAQPYRPPSPTAYRHGFSAIISQFRRDSLSPLSQLLATSYLPSYLARQEARDEGANEALMVNERGLLTQGSESHVFLVMGHIVLTPDLRNGLQPGITREAILELAPSLGIEAGEWNLWEKDIFQAQEAFLTNSLLGVMPLTQVSGQAIGSGQPGPVTRKFMAAYKRLVRQETRRS